MPEDADTRREALALRDRLAALAAAQGLSLRTYLSRLEERQLTPAERAEQAAMVKAKLFEINGYDPTPEEERALDAELRRRLRQAGALK